VNIQTKLLIPLAVLAIVLFFYIEILWLPQFVTKAEQKNTDSVKAHMDSVITGLVPLLLTNQLANIYDNLDTVQEKNPHWLRISVFDDKNYLLYPLSSPINDYSSKKLFTLEKDILYLDHKLGRMELIVDISSQIRDVKKLEVDALIVFVISMIFFIVAVLVILNLVVHAPLKKLIAASNEVAEGEYDAELPQGSKDEMGSLVASFKLMRDSIQKSQEALKREVKSHKYTADELFIEKERVTYHASHDALTGLVNRREFEVKARELLQASKLNNSQHVLLYIDLDQFKIVNDTCGHVAGDSLLRQLGALLNHKVREGDTLARLGGDEFGVLLERCPMQKAVTITGITMFLLLVRVLVWSQLPWKART
jgi:GGDEF domain-containing protein